MTDVEEQARANTPITGVTVFTDGARLTRRGRAAGRQGAWSSDLGEIVWTLTLPPGESSVIRHRFTVEHPAQAEVTGL
jgi:hypothetical protein